MGQKLPRPRLREPHQVLKFAIVVEPVPFLGGQAGVLLPLHQRPRGNELDNLFVGFHTGAV